MPQIAEAELLDALKEVIDPDLNRDIVSLGFIKDVSIKGNDVSFSIELTTPACPVKDLLKQQAFDAVKKIEGIGDVQIEMTSRVRQANKGEMIPDVKNVIAIASGKGGVGKSTVSVNLAIALSKTGAKVGLLDADVYGPSIPLMMGCADERPWTENAKILPIEKYGLKMMSLGFLLEEGQAVLWRGPMVAGTVKQLLTDVNWGELDYLVVDLPPGTGDAPMSLAQLVPLTGVVIVATPHDVAANIAGKAVQLFEKLKAPILGVIENMSLFVCPCCGETTKIFSGTSGQELADQLGVKFLGSIPLDPAISQSGDNGVPSIIARPENVQTETLFEIAGKLAAEASKQAMAEKDLIRGLKNIKR